MDPDAVRFVKHFFDHKKPVAAICHGPWMLVEADEVRGRTVSSWPSLKTDIANAGGTWVDQEVVVSNGVVTSRKPDDIPAFNREMIELFSKSAGTKRKVGIGLATNLPARPGVEPSQILAGPLQRFAHSSGQILPPHLRYFQATTREGKLNPATARTICSA